MRCVLISKLALAGAIAGHRDGGRGEEWPPRAAFKVYEMNNLSNR